MIQIYCGDGKGKTTAATGLAVRAAGTGRKVLIARFLKNNRSGELTALACIPGITVMPLEKEFGFIRSQDHAVRQEASAYYTAYFDKTVQKALQEDYDLLVLDEINAAITYELVPLSKLTAFLSDVPDRLEVVLTGRDPKPEVEQMADYISEIRKVRHPFDRGIMAREGIEF